MKHCSFLFILFLLLAIVYCSHISHEKYPAEIVENHLQNQYDIARIEIYKILVNNRCDCEAYYQLDGFCDTVRATTLLPVLRKLTVNHDTINYIFKFTLNNYNEDKIYQIEHNVYRGCFSVWRMSYLKGETLPIDCEAGERLTGFYTERTRHQIDSVFWACYFQSPNSFHPWVSTFLQRNKLLN